MRNESVLKIDVSNVMADKVGSIHGINDHEWQNLRKVSGKALSECLQSFETDKIGFMKLPADNKALDEIESLVKKHHKQWENLIVFGIGGSALGVTMLFNALCHPHHNLLDSNLRNHAPRLFVMDNIDPEELSSLKPLINPEKTMLNIITKSGGTIETWGNYFQFLSVFNIAPHPDQVVAITDPENGFLNKFAKTQQWQILPIPGDVGGRFSILTPVGLFSAAMLNVDIRGIIKGALLMQEHCMTVDLDVNPALKLAATTYHLLTTKKKTISVMMPYANSLGSFADWYRRLWAESLGKRSDLKGKTVYTGQAPVKAIGATDHHSQIQLYREGPNDKVITFLGVDSFRFGGPMNRAPENTPLEHLRLLDTSELLKLEMHGTRDALTESNRPNLTIQIPAVTPFYMGQLIYLYELTTYLTGILLNIDPFNQPGVEAGKLIAKEMIQQLHMKRTSLDS
ncbi:glucose-6-phosphate isomerase [bacterium]|nr:glucose-6-phosphate isomerase [bacterium]